ncbi:MAG: bifunctional heptose 7-phosphate kinase/heptose 1-phosphate adenyltransferase, partial [Bryobacteraceae bacterium]
MSPAEILAAIPRLRALVAGDICLDRWCRYDPRLTEPSRETGLDRVAVVSTECTPGAGGTVASNLAALGCSRVAVLGSIGEDGHGYELRAALERRGIDASLLVTAPGQTFTYTKLINTYTEVEDLGRIDFVTFPPPREVEDEILRRLEAAAGEFDLILVSDQMETASGAVVTPRMRERLELLQVRRPELLIWVDSRMHIEQFRGLVLKPNEREALEACRRLGFDEPDYAALRRLTRAPLMMVTRGGDGVALVSEEGMRQVPTRRVEHPVDICGAGDSFSAGAALALRAGASPQE